MRKLQFRFACVILSCTFGLSANAAEISWSPAFEIETDADIDLSGEIVRAINVVSPDVGEVEVEFPGGVAVTFEPQHTFEFNPDLDEEFASTGHVTGDGTFYSGQDEGLTTENPELDRVLDSHGWTGGGPGSTVAVLELADLTVGDTYQIQLIGAADDRGCCEYRQQVIVNTDLDPLPNDAGGELWFGRSNDFDGDGERGPGSTIGTFTADAATQQIWIMGTDEFDDGDGNFGNGNDPGLSAYILSKAGGPAIPGDFDGDGVIGAADLDAMAGFQQAGDAAGDINGDGATNFDDRLVMIKSIPTFVGDSNLDGEFNSSDFVAVFTAGKFEAGTAASWEEGDWNGDGQFTSGDFVAAFTDGGFETGPVPQASAVPEPSSIVLVLAGFLGLVARRRS